MPVMLFHQRVSVHAMPVHACAVMALRQMCCGGGIVWMSSAIVHAAVHAPSLQLYAVEGVDGSLVAVTVRAFVLGGL